MKNRDLPYYPVPNELEGYYADPKQCTQFIPFTGITKYEHCLLEFATALVKSGHTHPDDVLTMAVRLSQEYFDRVE